MRTFYRFGAAAAAVALLGAGCVFGQKVETESSTSGGLSQPVRGSAVSLTNCKASPAILQVSSGTEVSFKNNDAVSHTLRFMNDELVVAAGGSVAYRVTMPTDVSANFTLNFNCDMQNSGAIFIP